MGNNKATESVWDLKNIRFIAIIRCFFGVFYGTIARERETIFFI